MALEPPDLAIATTGSCIGRSPRMAGDKKLGATTDLAALGTSACAVRARLSLRVQNLVLGAKACLSHSDRLSATDF